VSIVVTGASGDLGRRVTADLLQRVPAGDLILVTRTPDALGEARAAGADVRHGDFEDEAGLRTAFRGGERLLLISSVVTGPRRVTQHRAAIAAAQAAGVRHVVYTSLVGVAEDNPAAVSADHLATEQALAASDLEVTVLRHSWHADVVAGVLAPAAGRIGRWTINTGDGQVAPVAKQDAAAAAAAVLTTDGHAGRTYDITGPELVTVGRLAATTAELLGRPVEFDDVDDAAMLELLRAAGVDRPEDLTSFGTAIREGWFAVRSDDVQRPSGRPAQPMRALLEASLRPAAAGA
jgi:NAD(P)H dehydrogenase (quinone)